MLCHCLNTGATLYQLSYKALRVVGKERVQLIPGRYMKKVRSYVYDINLIYALHSCEAT